MAKYVSKKEEIQKLIDRTLEVLKSGDDEIDLNKFVLGIMRNSGGSEKLIRAYILLLVKCGEIRIEDGIIKIGSGLNA